MQGELMVDIPAEVYWMLGILIVLLAIFGLISILNPELFRMAGLTMGYFG